MATQAITTTDKKETIADFLRLPEHKKNFEDMLGAGAEQFIQSAILVINASDDLLKCTKRSLKFSALRSAALGLSLDPALRQAYLIPRRRNIAGKNEKPNYIWEANFQPHYKGLHTLAMRTGDYSIINVSPVYEGQRVMEDPLTGLHAVMEENGFLGQPQSYNMAYSMDVTVRRKKDRKVIGWLAYFKTRKDFQKSIWMSTMEIEDHAVKHDVINNWGWKNSEIRPVMEMKTVLRELLSWADLSGDKNKVLREIIHDQFPDNGHVINATSEDVTPETKTDNGNPDPVKDSTWKDWETWRDLAGKMQIEVADVKRDATTENDLRAYIIEIAPGIRDAEAQAQVA